MAQRLPWGHARVEQVYNGIPYDLGWSNGISLTRLMRQNTEFRVSSSIIAEFRMNLSTFARLGHQIRQERLKADMTQRELASRVGRNAVRISEFERDLLKDRWGRDRLTLLAEICDALGLDIVLVPHASARAIESLVRGSPSSMPQEDVTSAFDDLFVDLGNDEDER